MIGVYHHFDLGRRINEFEIVSGSESRSINDAYTLQATVLPRTLKQKGIVITPFTVFRVNGIFYRQKLFSASDNEIGLIKIDAVDLLFADLIEGDLAVFEHTATAQAMLTALLAGTRFTVGACDNLGVKTVELKNTNRLAALNKILEQFDGEVYREGRTVSIKNKLDYMPGGQPFPLVKGKNIVTLEESIDTSAVITRLRYIDSTEEEPLTKVIHSQFINNYPVKEGYKEFRGNADEQARRFLEANELPHATYKVSVLPSFKGRFELGAMASILCEQININLTLRVVELSRDLTGRSGDRYTLGQKPKSFTELTADMFVREERLSEIINNPDAFLDAFEIEDMFTRMFDDKMADFGGTPGTGSGVIIRRLT